MVALFTISSVAALGWFLLFPYNAFRVDRLRQRLFLVRDELFDFAADGGISFASPAYVTGRASLNGMIRFAHRTSISQFLAFGFLMKDEHHRFARNERNESLRHASPNDVVIFDEYMRRANRELVFHLLSSPMMLIALPSLWTYLLAKAGIDATAAVIEALSKAFARLDEAAFIEGATSSRPLVRATTC